MPAPVAEHFGGAQHTDNLASILESSAPVGRARLDRMTQCLEEYLREAPPEAGTS